jgi:hypothetical protein
MIPPQNDSRVPHKRYPAWCRTGCFSGAVFPDAQMHRMHGCMQAGITCTGSSTEPASNDFVSVSFSILLQCARAGPKRWGAFRPSDTTAVHMYPAPGQAEEGFASQDAIAECMHSAVAIAAGWRVRIRHYSSVHVCCRSVGRCPRRMAMHACIHACVWP